MRDPPHTFVLEDIVKLLSVRSIARRARGLAATGLLAGALVTAATPSAASAQSADIVDTAVAAGQFTTLAAALQAGGLVDTLKGPGPFTVFAPTDAAFAKLPAGTVESLLANPDQLRGVLTYHVVGGEVPASEVVGLSSAPSVQGEPIGISVANNEVLLNESTRVVQTDIMAANGVIHVIDSVLLPPSLTATAPAAPAPATEQAREVARDGQSLASQPPATQALFAAVWGNAAATQWVREHEANLARMGR
jgi:uncharacterized surface protein with fasciclin (FAS1) repeats